MTIGPIARHVTRTIRECCRADLHAGWETEFARAENTYQVDIAIYVGADHFAVMRSALRDRGCKLPLARLRADRAARAEFNGPVKSYTYETSTEVEAQRARIDDFRASYPKYVDNARTQIANLFSEPQPVRAGTIAGHVIYKIKGARTDDELREREGCMQASIARRVGANELETIRAAILDRCARAGA